MSDQQLWDRLKSGEQSALREIYEQHIDFLLGYGRRFGKDMTIVEDSIHDLFVHLWQKRKSIGGTDKIRPYLVTALRRRIIKNHGNQKGSTSDQPIETYNFQAEPAIENKIIKSERELEQNEKLAVAMAKLSEREKEVLIHKYHHDMDYKDISLVMDINYQSVRNLVARALKKLRSGLQIVWLLFLLCV
ncbi:MAG: sigma-70 family RNA polymerase sigma factor [Bacteroidota bacterium]